MNEKKPNIIFIVMDALRPDHLGCYGYEKKTSPNIDWLAKEGVLFEKFFSSNNATYKSLLSILSGRHILLGKEKDFFYSRKEIEGFFSSGGVFLQQILKKQGYKTYSLKHLLEWQKRGFDFTQKDLEEREHKTFKESFLFRKIFRKIIYLMPRFISEKIKERYGRNESEEVTKKAIEIIKDSKKNSFFLWIDYNDTHIPYNPKMFTGKFKAEKKSEKLRKLFSKGEYDRKIVEFWKNASSFYDTLEDIKAKYDSAIFYNDYLIGRVIKSLKEEKILNNTIIFFFSDHGENIGDHGIFFDHHGLYDSSIHAPLIIYGKNLGKKKKISCFTQHEDIVPTILDFLKIPYEEGLFDGKSLLPLIKGKKQKIRDYVFTEEGDKMRKRGLRTGDYKYIESEKREDALCSVCNIIHGGVIELYNLKNDKKEEINLAKEMPKVLLKFSMKMRGITEEKRRLDEKRRIRSILKNT